MSWRLIAAAAVGFALVIVISAGCIKGGGRVIQRWPPTRDPIPHTEQP